VVRRTPTERVLGWLLAAAAAEFGLLAVTGVFLVFFYRPSAAHAWGDLRGSQSASVTAGEAVRIVHRLTASAMVLTVVAAAGLALTLAIARSLRSRGNGRTAAAWVAIAVVGLFASFTGYLLPWDQLALWAVTVGTNMMGFMPIIRHSQLVQYVLIGGASISVDTIRFWLFVHVLVVPAVLLGLGLFLLRRLLAGRHEPDPHTGRGP
jgi:quinol-cytochrome oxidoreductase complex cytochrome b subunit